MTVYYSTTKMSTQLFEYMDTKYSFEFVSVSLRMGYRGIVHVIHVSHVVILLS